MSIGLLGQYVINGAMLGMMYALVAVGFTLFFGVLDVIKFSHGDLVTGGAFAGLAIFSLLGQLEGAAWWMTLVVVISAAFSMAALGALIARLLVFPLRSAPSLNTLWFTLLAGPVSREPTRLSFPAP